MPIPSWDELYDRMLPSSRLFRVMREVIKRKKIDEEYLKFLNGRSKNDGAFSAWFAALYTYRKRNRIIHGEPFSLEIIALSRALERYLIENIRFVTDTLHRKKTHL